MELIEECKFDGTPNEFGSALSTISDQRADLSIQVSHKSDGRVRVNFNSKEPFAQGRAMANVRSNGTVISLYALKANQWSYLSQIWTIITGLLEGQGWSISNLAENSPVGNVDLSKASDDEKELPETIRAIRFLNDFVIWLPSREIAGIIGETLNKLGYRIDPYDFGETALFNIYNGSEEKVAWFSTSPLPGKLYNYHWFGDDLSEDNQWRREETKLVNREICREIWHEQNRQKTIQRGLERFQKAREAKNPLPTFVNDIARDIPYMELHDVLIDCGPLDSNQSMLNIFYDERIKPFRNLVTEGYNKQERATSLIKSLRDQKNTKGQNALGLYLQVAADLRHKQDACHQKLIRLAKALLNDT